MDEFAEYDKAGDSSFGSEGESRGYADDATWILTSSFVIFTMQSGFGMLEAGSCSPGFEVNIMMKNIVDVVFTALTYYLVGFGISFGQPSTPFMGKGSMPADGGYGEVTSGLLYSQYIFQLSFAATSTTIVSGCVAMRLKFFIYVLYSLIAVIFYSFVAHWIFDEGGWLNQMGAHDFAGGAPVHVFGGTNGLVATLFLGPRLGRFDGSRPISDFFPSSVSSQCLGMLTLWWGWIGFNCGSSFGITDERWVVAIRCAVTTINSTVGGGIMSIIYTLWRTRGALVIPEHLINGILGSLVAITPACASVHTYDAFPIGVVGAIVGLGVNTIVCRCEIDDPVGAIGVHAGAGVWGLIAVGLFADSDLIGLDVMDGLFRGGGFKLLGIQLLAIVATIGWSLMWSITFFYIVGISISRDWRDPRKGLRVDIEEEERGADWHLHGVIDQEAYMANLDKESTHGNDGVGSLSSDNEFHENGKPQMSMRSLFKGHFDDLQRFKDNSDRSSHGTNNEILGDIKEAINGDRIHKGSAKEKADDDYSNRRRRTLVIDMDDEPRRQDNPDPMLHRTQISHRGMGLNGGLGHAVFTQSVLNEMSPDQMRTARRAPRNLGVLGHSTASLAVNESVRAATVPSERNDGRMRRTMVMGMGGEPGQQERNDDRSRMMQRSRSSAARKLQIYR